MPTRIGTEYFVNLNAAIRYSTPYQSHLQPAELRREINKKINEGAIKLGRPPTKDGHIIVLNNAEGRYFYEELPKSKTYSSASTMVEQVKAEKDSASTGLRAAVENLKNAVENCLQGGSVIKLSETPKDDDKPEGYTHPAANWPFGTHERVEAGTITPTERVEAGTITPTERVEGGTLGPVNETERLLSSPANAAHLERSTAQAAAGEAKERELIETSGDLTHGRVVTYRDGSSVHIKTNNQPRELLFFRDLTEQERAEMSHVVKGTQSFFRHKGAVYHTASFMKIAPAVTEEDKLSPYAGWDGILAENLTSGVLIRYPRIEQEKIDMRRVVIGTYYVGEAPADPRGENNVPNLDAIEDPKELLAFHEKHKGGAKFKDLFPNGGEGVKSATSSLAAYAAIKAEAVKQRKKGKIDKAQINEAICQRTYDALPAWAKW